MGIPWMVRFGAVAKLDLDGQILLLYILLQLRLLQRRGGHLLEQPLSWVSSDHVGVVSQLVVMKRCGHQT